MKKLSYIFFLTFTTINCLFCHAKSSEKKINEQLNLLIDWQKTNWDPIDFKKITFANQSSLFYYQNTESSPLFYLSLVFMNGKNSFDTNERLALDFLIELLNWNLKSRNHPNCKSDGNDNLSVEYYYTSNGKVVFNFVGLNKNLSAHLAHVTCVFNNPFYSQDDLSYAISQREDKFKQAFSFSNYSDIQDFMISETEYLAYGYKNDYNNFKVIKKLNAKDFYALHKKIVQSNGLKIAYVATSNEDRVPVLEKFVTQIPKIEIYPDLFQHEFKLVNNSNKYKLYYIHNPDLEQNYVLIDHLFASNQYFNEPDNTNLQILFNDFKYNQFYSAIRLDNGISYNPVTIFNDSAFSLIYESSSSKLEDSVNITLDLIDNYIKNGITTENLLSAKRNIIHNELKREFIERDILNLITAKIAQDRLPAIDINEYLARIKHANNINNLNSTLKSYFNREKFSVIIIIGSIEFQDLLKLKNNPKIQSIDILPIKNYKELYLKRLDKK